MPKIRVLVVDDSVVIRKLVSDTLSADPDIEVAGSAANGKIAIQKIPQINPDLVTLDMEMPEMDGLATVKAIRATHPKLPIIMFSTLTARGAEVTLDALKLGASDYVTKPANVGSVSIAGERIREELIPKIRALCPHIVPKRMEPTAFSPTPAPTQKVAATSSASSTAVRSAPKAKQPQIVAIGVSTGGPNALADVLPLLPADFPLPIVIVQHMPPVFTRMLAERISAKSKLPAHEGEEGMLVEPGHIYVAPGDFHMELKRDPKLRITLHQGPRENSCRPAVDPLFRSVVGLFGAETLGVILTGMGQDGLRGCELIKEAGGIVLAQDEASSVVWGMPGYVAQAGLADRVLPLSQIASEINRLCSKDVLARLAAEVR